MQSLNRLAARVAGKIPLRTVVIVPFVLQIVGTVRFVGYLSFKSGQNAVEELAHQLMGQVGERISDRSISSSRFWSEPGRTIGYGRTMSEEERELASRLTGENLSIGTRYLNEISKAHPGKRRLYLLDANRKPQKLVYWLVDDFCKNNRHHHWLLWL